MKSIAYIFIAILAAILLGCMPMPRYLPRRLAPPQTEKFALPDDESLLGTINYYIGTPYKYGGCTKNGMDCSCLVQTVFRESLGIDLPRTVAEQWKTGKPIKNDDLAFGDIVFFETTRSKIPSHSGIYIGGGRFAHASSSLGVTITPMSDSYWKKRYVGTRRMITR